MDMVGRHALLCWTKCLQNILNMARQGLLGAKLLPLLVLPETVGGEKVEQEGVVQSSHLGHHDGRVGAIREDTNCIKVGLCASSYQRDNTC